MQTFMHTDRQRVQPHTMGVRVMLLTDHPDGVTAQRLISYGSIVDVVPEFYAAMSGILDDPMGYDLFVMDCDGFGGVEAAERAISTLIAGDARMRIMLVSEEFDIPVYPLGRRTAVCLPDMVTEASFRIGFDHVLRDRAAITLM